MARPRIDLVATIDPVGALTPSPAAEVPEGFDLCSVQIKADGVTFGGDTVVATLEGSNAPGDVAPTAAADWVPVARPNEAGDVDASFTADGSAMAGQPNQLSAVGQFRWIRLNLSSGAVATDGTVTAWCVSPGQVGSGYDSN